MATRVCPRSLVRGARPLAWVRIFTRSSIAPTAAIPKARTRAACTPTFRRSAKSTSAHGNSGHQEQPAHGGCRLLCEVLEADLRRIALDGFAEAGAEPGNQARPQPKRQRQADQTGARGAEGERIGSAWGGGIQRRDRGCDLVGQRGKHGSPEAREGGEGMAAWPGTRCANNRVCREESLSRRGDADAPPRRSVQDSTEKHLPERPTQRPQRAGKFVAPTPGGRVVSSSRKPDTYGGVYHWSVGNLLIRGVFDDGYARMRGGCRAR